MRKPDLAVIDPGMGNLRSVCKAWEHAGASVRLCADPADVGTADALIFPGQGGMIHCMEALQARGFDRLIKNWIQADRPFFGICLGLQALFSFSEEGNTQTLGIFPGQVRRFNLDHSYKIPHMGWNSVTFREPGSSQTVDGGQFYFVHSYYLQTDDQSLIWGESDYGGTFVSAIRQGRCYATQFHPEKSQAKGLQLYRNFVEIL